MNSKQMANNNYKKLSTKRTPLQTSLSQNSTSGYGLTARSLTLFGYNKQISVEEHNKVLIQNQRLAKENSVLKSQLSAYKESLRKKSNNNVEQKQHLTKARIENESLKQQIKSMVNTCEVIDRIKYMVDVLIEVDNKVGTMKGVMTSLESTLVSNNNNSNTNNTVAADADITNESVDPFWTLNESSRHESYRYSLTSQEQDIRRRLSADRIKHDFQVMTELSTILEMSRENRISSFGFIADTTHNSVSMDTINTEAMNDIVVNDVNMATTSTANSNAVTVDTTKVKTSKRNSSGKTVKAKRSRRTKGQTAAAKQTKGKSIETSVTNSSPNDISIYDFTDDDDKENIAPIFSKKVVTRKSKRIGSMAKKTVPL
ncbi:uncharacterized protein LOC128959645 [Oppia nitens]|uniref:uncharacterized protein LOC128959645 n=1 Tax=Oppia nitens TaxID=1686743 RepID=UPI0023DC9D12|nr:uncharacterized protein LOC128959645 [Oppia nitens]